MKCIQNTKSMNDCAQPTATSSDQVKCHRPITAPRTRPLLIGLIVVMVFYPLVEIVLSCAGDPTIANLHVRFLDRSPGDALCCVFLAWTVEVRCESIVESLAASNATDSIRSTSRSPVT